MNATSDIIVALATPSGEGAIGIIRLSGKGCIELADKIFYGKNLTKVEGNTVHYGKIKRTDGSILDECVATIFKAPRSYTKEDIIEFSCHGSSYILEELVKMLITNGARHAEAGEFTKRAFLNGQLDLSQAEAVADLISSSTKNQHEVAIKQLRGGITDRIGQLRKRLIKFASLIELENDFGEEDVEFANREELHQLVTDIQKLISRLMETFAYGNALKRGVPVAIVGETNVGKSTLLNALLQEDKAIVSSIAGTTRDVIEDTMQIDGIWFRFMDTAGIRQTQDEIESLGIERTMSQIAKAKVILIVGVLQEDYKGFVDQFKALRLQPDQKVILLLNKSDQYNHQCHSYDIEEAVSTTTGRQKTLIISAKEGTGLTQLKTDLVKMIKKDHPQDEIIITNLRHQEALQKTHQSLADVLQGMKDEVPTDLIAIDIRHAMNALGVISGEIYTDDLLESIFRDFCIGK